MKKKADTDRLSDPAVARAIASFVPAQVFERVARHPDKLDRVGERRNVTVLFVDIVGFTPFCEGRDAEEVMELLNELFEKIIEAVSRYGGTVDKFMGDAAVVLFGAPVAHEDDPIRALAASLEITEAISGFHGLKISIGVNTGNVVAGIVGDDSHREYTVIGDPVNTASRLQNAAASGEILVGPETYEKSKLDFEFGEPVELTLKGKSRPVLARRLLSSKLRHPILSLPRLIGRDKENRKLSEILKKPGATAAIIGEPGTGKSILLGHLKEKAAAAGMQIIDITAIPWRENIPYHPIQPLVRGILGHRPEKEFLRLLPGDSDLLPLLSGILGIEIEATERTEYLSPFEKREALKNLLVRLFKVFAGDKPILVAVDNAENLDPSTAELIENLGSSEDIVNIIAGRSLEILPDLEVDSKITLRTLSKSAVKVILRELLSAKMVGSDLVEEVYSETAGNPGYIVELIKLFRSKNAISVQKGVYRITQAITEELPDDIEGILTARVDNLPPDARETLRVSSVLGPEFPGQLLIGIIGEKVSEKGIRQLSREGLLEISGDKLRFFSRSLLKASYNSMLISARKEIHRSAAEKIESEFKAKIVDFYEDLARHYESGDIPKEAFRYQVYAGQKQEERFANKEALYYYLKVLEVDDDDAIEWDLWRELFGALDSTGKIYWYHGELEKVISLNERARNLASRMDDLPLMTDAINRIALANQEMGNIEKAKEIYEKQLDTLSNLKNEKERLLQVMTNLGTLLADMGELDNARDIYNKGLKMAGADHKSAGVANLLGNLAWIEGHFGNWDRARQLLRRSGEIDRELGDLRGQALTAVNLAQVYRADYNKDREIAEYEKALKLFRRIGDRRGEALCLSNLGDTTREKGEPKKAAKLHRKALKIARELNDPQRIVDGELGLALDSAESGDIDSAIRRASKAFKIAANAGDWEGEIEVGIGLLGLYAKSGNRKAFEKLKSEIEDIILKNNPSAIKRLEEIEIAE